jgi:hypothetical protein
VTDITRSLEADDYAGPVERGLVPVPQVSRGALAAMPEGRDVFGYVVDAEGQFLVLSPGDAGVI